VALHFLERLSPEHPPHRSFSQAFAEFMLEHLGGDDDASSR
jgi:hypothetical protein